MKNFYRSKLALTLLLLSLALLFSYACGTAYEPPSEEEKEQNKGIPDDSIADNDPVSADKTLETVTWNLNWYGDKIYGDKGANGPSDEVQQTKNIIRIVDSLKADLYAFQEVHSRQALTDIAENMSGYNGFVADYIDWIQKTAFVYNTNTIDSLSAGAITEGQERNAWADGRFPLYFEFTYTFQEDSHSFYAIVIHAKAFDDQSSYERRKKAARDLYGYLTENKPDANIIFMGDYNDDVDESIYMQENGEPAKTPYQPFAADSNNFNIITQALSEAGESSTINYPDMIDHITMSNELYPLYVDKSAEVFAFDDGFISNYGETTTDHYPVWAKFDVTTPMKLVKTQ